MGVGATVSLVLYPVAMAYPKLTSRLTIWLGDFRDRHKWICWGAAAGVALLAALSWFLSYWLIYFVLWFAFSWLLGSPMLLSVGTMVVMGILVEAHRRANWQYLEELEADHPMLAQTLRTAGWITGEHFLAIAGQKTLSSFIKVLSMIALTAPRLSQLAFELIKRGQTAATLDPLPCATVLAKLIKSDRKVRLNDLMKKYPAFDWPRTLREVTLIEGVRVRLAEVPLVSISDERRDSLSTELEQIPHPAGFGPSEDEPEVRPVTPLPPIPLFESDSDTPISTFETERELPEERPPA